MSATLNMFDLIFIFATIFIVLIAFFRGFVRELFSVINWVLAGFLVYAISPYLVKPLLGIAGGATMANIIASTISFIVIFIVTTILTRKMAFACKEKIPYTTDQILGTVFGALKAFFIFGFVYAASINLHSSLYGIEKDAKLQEKMPSWLYQSKFRGIIAPFATILNPMVEASIDDSQTRFLGKEVDSKKEGKKTKSQIKRQKLNEEKLQPYGIFNKNYQKIKENFKKTEEKPKKIKKTKKVSEIYKEKGYSKKEIEKMDRLIEIIE